MKEETKEALIKMTILLVAGAGMFWILLLINIISLQQPTNQTEQQAYDAYFNSLNASNASTSQPGYTYFGVTYQEHELTLIQNISQQVASSHVYNNNPENGTIFNCVEFSDALINALRANNILAYCVFGLYYSTGNKSKIGVQYALHDWVELNVSNQTYDIEATQGYIIPNDTYLNYYKPIEKGNCL